MTGTTNKRDVKKTLEFYGSLPFCSLQEHSGVPRGSFGRVLSHLRESGEIHFRDGRYHLPGDSSDSDIDIPVDTDTFGDTSTAVTEEKPIDKPETPASFPGMGVYSHQDGTMIPYSDMRKQ
jgi:hypothetical protein